MECRKSRRRNSLAGWSVRGSDPKVVSGILLVVILAAYAARAAYWIPQVRGQINPDGVAYISLAQSYRAGDFVNGISAHWGPMFSWLLAPLLAFGIEPLLACKLETFATGLATLVAAWFLSSRFTQNVWLRVMSCAALVPFLLETAGGIITPDLLMVCFLTCYAYFISDPTMSRRSILAAASFGALGYLTKSYGFAFFLTHFSMACGVRWLWGGRGRRGEILRRYGLGLAVFCALSLPWATVLSLKYERLTFGTAGHYNFGLVGPANGPVGSQSHPMHTQGLLDPPGGHAVSAWDDPALLHFPPWPAWPESFRRLKALCARNASILYGLLRNGSLLTWPLLLAACVVAFIPGLRDAQSRLLIATVGSGAFYAAGYLPLLIDPRYVWILTVLLLMIAVGLVDLLAKKFHLRAITSALIGGAILATFVSNPKWRVPLPDEIDLESARLARNLEAAGFDLHGRRLATNGYWSASLYVAYFTGARYFGTVVPGDSADVRSELDRHRIDTFLFWGNGNAAPIYLDGFVPIWGTAAGGAYAFYARTLDDPSSAP